MSNGIGCPQWRMSALGQKQTFREARGMSALPPKADMCGATRDVRFGPEADTAAHLESSKGGNAYLGHLRCK
jgi:hypothetical protein